MRNSKILLGAAAAVGILILVIFTAVFFLAGGTASQPDDMFVHDFDGQIADMKIVNGEKEYFAVKAQQGKHDSYYNVYDRQLNPLLETELSFAGEKVGRYLPLGNYKDQWWLLDVETLELHETDLIEPVIHESGEYMAGQTSRGMPSPKPVMKRAAMSGTRLSTCGPVKWNTPPRTSKTSWKAAWGTGK